MLLHWTSANFLSWLNRLCLWLRSLEDGPVSHEAPRHQIDSIPVGADALLDISIDCDKKSLVDFSDATSVYISHDARDDVDDDDGINHQISITTICWAGTSARAQQYVPSDLTDFL
jgi:hypothetical protein